MVKRITFSATERALKAITLAAEQTGDSQTDVLNQAAQRNAYVLYLLGQGATVQAVHPDGTVTPLDLLWTGGAIPDS